ncbi:uracil/xanthine transporter [Pseudogracilibacillus sp. SE30717A]|uniref:uracil/xanthine transporter n=1 Tax=Pseudogracilibacillus sp. SE30717A TaxID=3098293 RepID=UPI00300DFE54
MHELKETKSWIAGVQWFFFIFANIVIIPITVGEAFGLAQHEIVPLLQLSFIVTGLACLAQAIIGHRRPILEGQSGLWWGIFLTLVVTTSAQGMPLEVLGGSLALGVIISGIITILIGITGIGPMIARLFNPGVMGVFMFLLGLTLIQIFLKGMLGIPFGKAADSATIDLPVAGIAIFIALLVIVISIKSPARIRSYALLIGIILGWILYTIIFGTDPNPSKEVATFKLFPFGSLTWDVGVVVTAVLAGLLNISNTFGSLKGTDAMFQTTTTKKDYLSSFSITGIATVAAGFFGLVPYAPFVSSIGFLRQTNIFDRLPFIIGSFLFFIMGVIQPVGAFFSTLPLSIGSAVLFVAYLQLFNSSMEFFKGVLFNTLNVYRSAIPLFVGTIIMAFPASYFESIPAFIRPFMSNGLLVGIILALVLENILNWDRVGATIKDYQQMTKEIGK